MEGVGAMFARFSHVLGHDMLLRLLDSSWTPVGPGRSVTEKVHKYLVSDVITWKIYYTGFRPHVQGRPAVCA